MPKLRHLVLRRKAIQNIRKITRTMELIATARFKRALDRAVEAEAYTRKIAELAADLSAATLPASAGHTLQHLLLEKREPVRSSLLLVICSNRGLCGGYNSAILRVATERMQQYEQSGVRLYLELSGKRAIAYFRYHGVPSEAQYTHFEDKPRFEEVEVLANRYLDGYLTRRYDQVEVAYMKFLSASRQTPVVETLLPLSTIAPPVRRPGWGTSATSPIAEPTPASLARSTSVVSSTIEYEFLPDPRSILEELLPMSLKVRLFKCFLDAAVSEQIARRIAMKQATDNATEMIRVITRQYNRARQAHITKEILEVLSGAEALK
ncbi:MAG: ATP synthase F1 subunit gamma [Gemmatales bacterium]|nr:ATP synthase F1 subunit gamma [Gemmatales bacterium]MDW7994513.1 ATP synthase F1 subunit gamma [Gemmatales bacterium]